jgi:Glycogen recognition site of AMP-activated protein kinase
MRPDDPSEQSPDPVIEWVTAQLRAPVPLTPRVERVVLDRLRAGPAHAIDAGSRRPRWPAAAAAVAAGLAAAFAAGVAVGRRSDAPAGAANVRSIEFALRTAADSAVALVGDFNDWDAQATPLHRAADGVWSVTVPLRPGRYRYTFIVDGTRWSRDPAAPRALEDDFGAPTSVITIAQR